jgi:hypothetical protein
MINFNKIHFMPDEIAILNNGGIITCWLISELFDVKFSLEECIDLAKFNSNKGFDGTKIKTFTSENGLYYFDTDKNTIISYQKYDELLNNNIIGGIMFTGYGDDNTPYSSLLTKMQGSNFLMTYGPTDWNDFEKVKGLYIFFVSTLPDISKFLKVKGGTLKRFPPYPLLGSSL